MTEQNPELPPGYEDTIDVMEVDEEGNEILAPPGRCLEDDQTPSADENQR
jgi:hypothetical protein